MHYNKYMYEFKDYCFIFSIFPFRILCLHLTVIPIFCNLFTFKGEFLTR